jgi:ArsR family transcriptional regulator
MTPITFYKCLADETRLKSLMLIQQQGELCVCELTCALDLSQPKISRHLAQLRKCELLLDRREGQWVYYRINPALQSWALQVLAVTADDNGAWIASSKKALSDMKNRPVNSAACC